MPKVLTQESSVTCGHSPGVVATQGVPTLHVNGKPVLLESGISGKSVAGCSTVPSTDVAGVVQDKTCTSVTGVTNGKASKLFVAGVPVILDTLTGTTDGLVTKTPQDKLSASAIQNKLTAI